MELDKEALHVDAGWNYQGIYLETLHSPHPRQIMDKKLVDLSTIELNCGCSEDMVSLKSRIIRCRASKLCCKTLAA